MEMTNINYVFVTSCRNTKARVDIPTLLHTLQFSMPFLFICLKYICKIQNVNKECD